MLCLSFCIFIAFSLNYFTFSSLIDFKRCQRTYNCSNNLKPSDCPPKFYFDVHFGPGKCCHGCRFAIGRGAHGCRKTNIYKQCAAGLECNQDYYCILQRKSCLHTIHFDDTIGWKPSCEVDGSYSAKQCRGDKVTGRCFCYSETGEKIFGWDWWKNADSMSCACSRQRFKAEASGRVDVTLRCKSNGNYESLQCDRGICWCAEEMTGFILQDTVAVPENLWTFLPCYNSTEHGDQYLRKCESAAHAQKMILKKLINRGVVNAVPSKIRCGYDGRYAEIINENQFTFCQTPDGTKLRYASPSKMSMNMNCNCAIDEMNFKNAGIEFRLRCKDNGNYEVIQEQNGKFFCVDRDGYAVSGLVKALTDVDCNQFIYYEQEDVFERS